ncbi:MAG: universal stress protein [Gaiellales bacterium]
MSAAAPRVVVGVDGSAESLSALQFAAEEARLRDAQLEIVYVWSASSADYVGEAFAPTPDAFTAAERHADDALRAAIAQLPADVRSTARRITIEGHASTELVAHSDGAALLVLGSRGRSAAASLLLGSVSQAVAHHVRCPLAIVPPATRDCCR